MKTLTIESLNWLKWEKVKPTEEDVIQNSAEDTLYRYKITGSDGTGDINFFQVIHSDDSSMDIQISKKMMFRVSFHSSREDFDSLEIIQLEIHKWWTVEKSKVRISAFNLTKLKQFLQLLTEIDTKWVAERKIRLGSMFEWEFDAEAKRAILELLQRENSTDIVEALLENGLLSNKDIVNSWYRKAQLVIFRKLLDEADYLETYMDQEALTDRKEEKVWQHFFEQNPWIFWYWLQYRFQSILQREAHVWDADIDGGWSTITDYLLADDHFTSFVELKKPSTSIFSARINRSSAWGLSRDLIDSVSQTLGQKASWQIKFESQELYDTDGNIITQGMCDSKVILIIGNSIQFIWENDKETNIKKRTFELYRRDSRNIEIITYDELFERASHIVWGKKEKTELTEEQAVPF